MGATLKGWKRYERMAIGEFFEWMQSPGVEGDEVLAEVLFYLSSKLETLAHTEMSGGFSGGGRVIRFSLRRGHLPASIKVFPVEDRFCYEFESPAGTTREEFGGDVTFGNLVDSLYFGPMLKWVRDVNGDPTTRCVALG